MNFGCVDLRWEESCPKNFGGRHIQGVWGGHVQNSVTMGVWCFLSWNVKSEPVFSAIDGDSKFGEKISGQEVDWTRWGVEKLMLGFLVFHLYCQWKGIWLWLFFSWKANDGEDFVRKWVLVCIYTWYCCSCVDHEGDGLSIDVTGHYWVKFGGHDVTCGGHWVTSLVIFKALFPGGIWHLVWLGGHASSSASSWGASMLEALSSVGGWWSSLSPLKAFSVPVVTVAAYEASGIEVFSVLTSILTTAVPSSWSERRGTLSPLILAGRWGLRGDRGLIVSFSFHSLCYCFCYFHI